MREIRVRGDDRPGEARTRPAAGRNVLRRWTDLRPDVHPDGTGRMNDVGRRFAYRERARTPGDPVRPVELVKEGPPRSRKVRVRRLDGEYEGLEEWVPAVRLVAPWEEAEALLEDERSTLAALEVSGNALGTVPHRAAELVFLSVPQEPGAEVSFGYRAAERGLLLIDDLEAASERLGLDTPGLIAEPLAHVDRLGVYRAPFGVAVKVARRCCRRFGGEVLRRVEERERELQGELATGRLASWDEAPEGLPAGPRWVSPEAVREHARTKLEKAAPAFALVREWCGRGTVEEFEEARALREEVDRLRALAEDTARWLRDSGHPVKAAALRRELDVAEPSPKDPKLPG